MTDDDQRMTMTKAEFRTYVDEAFINGSKAALTTAANVIAELMARLDNETPGDINEEQADE